MGQKVNPVGLRLGINRTWESRWYADDDYGSLLHEDLRIREYLRKRLTQAGVSRIIIERPAKKARITIHTARPGVVIGKKGAFLAGRSMTMRETPAWDRRLRRNSRICRSSCSIRPKSSSAYQRDSQVRLMPSLRPTGLTF